MTRKRNRLVALSALMSLVALCITVDAKPGGGGGGAPGFNHHRQLAGHVDVPVKGLSKFHAVVWTLP